jgi:predicted CoA-binding protein
MKVQSTVVVLGASNKPDRYSNMAVRLLTAKGHRVIPVHPKLPSVEGIPVVSSLDLVREPVDTLALYVNPVMSSRMTDAILALKPGRVIFNPGTESDELQTALNEHRIPWVKACTLVMLQTGQF